MTEKENNTPVRNFSNAGIEKLHEMAENNELYIDFLKFQGRVFKHSTSVALEFFTQRPETKFIATREQWSKANYTVSQGSDAIQFVDSKGRKIDFYDFSQVEETEPPRQWTINKGNAEKVKSSLGIPEKTPIINGIINSNIKSESITSCMSALGISPEYYRKFSKSYLNAVQLVIAGRLETGGNNFNIPSDSEILKMLKTDSQRLAFLTHAANTARELLMKIERAVYDVNTAERIEKNELRKMDNADGERKTESTGRGITDNTAGNAGEQSDRIESSENERRIGLGNNAESERRQEHEVVSGVQNENGEQSEILVQVQSDMRTVQSESDGLGNVGGGRTDRDLRNEVDEFHGEILPSSGGRNETVSQVSDSSTFSEQERNELQEFAGRTVRTDESTSDRLRGSTEMGTGENVLLGQHGDERNSPDSGDRSIDEKLNAFFTEEPVLTETAETEKVVTNDNFLENNLTTDDDDEIDTGDFSEDFDSEPDNATKKVDQLVNFSKNSLTTDDDEIDTNDFSEDFDSEPDSATKKVATNGNFSKNSLTTDDDNEIDTDDFSEDFDSEPDSATKKVATYGNFDSDSLSDEEQLVKITAEISKKMAEFTELVTNEDFAEAVDVSKELQQLTQHSAELKKKIQQKQITVDDIDTLRNIQPSRKSVQNMLDSEISQIPKFEKLLQDEFGDKSAFEMRNSDNSRFEDDSQTVPVIKVQNHNIPNKLTLLRNKEYLPEFNRGTFTNKHSNITIIFGKKSIEETIAKSIQDKRRNIPVDARINALYNAEELIENSVIFDTQLPKYSEKNSNDKNSNTLFMHNLYAVMTYDGQPYLAKLSVKESYSTDLDDVLVNTMNRLYNLKDIKITPIEANRIFSPTVNSDNAAEDTSINATFYISISQLYELVKAYDKNFFENPEAIGREERETEILVHAEYDDAVETLKTGEKTTAKVDKAVENLAKNHNTDIQQAKNIAEQLKKRRSKNGDVIIGNTTFKYIPEKTYTKIDRETAEKVAEQLENQGIKFSGVIKGDTVTITVSKPNKEILDKIIADISESTEKEKVATNGNSGITEKTPTDFINKMKELVLNDDSIRNAALNSDDDLLNLEIKTKLQNYSTQILIENTETYADDYNNFSGNVNEIADKTAEEIFQTAIKLRDKEQEKTVPVSDEEIINNIVNSVMEQLMTNDSLKSAAENNGIKDFEFAYNEKIDVVLLDMLNDSNGKKADIISSMLDNDSGIKDKSFDEYIEHIYNSLRYDSKKSATLDLEVGDVIRYENKRYEIERISEEEIALKDLDSPDYGGVLLSSVTVIGQPFNDWRKVLESSGYEILSKADKNEQRIDLMSDSADVKDVPFYSPKSIVLEYKGNAENIEEIKNIALSVSSYCTTSEDKTYIAVHTTENHKNELDEIADTLGLTKIENEQKAPSKTADALVVGDIISYGDIKGTITKIDDVVLTVKTSADPILGETIRGIIHWKDKFEKNGFEYHGHEKSEHIENVSEKKVKNVSEPDKGQLNLFESSEQTTQSDIQVNPDKLHETFESIKREYPDLSEKALRFLDRIEKLMKNSNSDTITPKILQSPAVQISFGGYKQINKMFDEKLAEVVNKINNRLSGKENIPKTSESNSEKLYKRFAEMFPEIVSGEHKYERYGNIGDAYEPLTVEHLGGNTYAFMTYFMQNGDLMRDPDFEFELDRQNKTLNITQYQQDSSIFGTTYQRVYDENGNPDLKLLSSLEKNFMQNLENAENMKRQLTSYVDKNGERYDTNDNQENTEPKEPEIDDKSPNLRAVLNEFSEKHGLGELNIEPTNYNWKLTEKFQDGTDFQLGELNSPEYGKPFNPQELRTALEDFEKKADMRGQKISERYNRKSIAESHKGVSLLPKVQKNLPEIFYASKPSEKIRNNITAIREMIRLENADKQGISPYDSRSNQYNSKQNSEYRLRQYCGWGGISQVFDERFKQYDYIRTELHSMLSPEEYAEARASSLNAHYTPQIIIDAMYKAVQNMDLPRDAKILEPACGTGNFITRLPHSLSEAEIIGIELDSITARIAKQINRENENVQIINSGFENSNLANNSFDLAIGNVPFGDYNMNDPDYTQNWKIHDAFFRKALDKVAPGGVVAFVTSTGTMDKSSPKIREYLAARADLIGAVRLPDNAFSDAGTAVSSDIIFLKKRENPLSENEPKPDWCYTIPDKNGLKINSYFVQNPQMVLGEMKKTTFQDRLTCKAFEGADLEKQLNAVIKNLNAKITVAKHEKQVNEQLGKIEPWGKNFTFQLKDDKIYYNIGDKMEEIKCSQTEKEMIEKLCEIRDLTRKLIDLQKTPIQDSELTSMRENLNKIYDEYNEKYGRLTDKSVKKLFGDDADYPILQSLENYNKETGQVEKADIFFRRTVNPRFEIRSVESTEEALQVSLDRKGKPDIQYMAILLDKSPEIICEELLKKGQIFIDPEKELPDKPFSGVVERSEYLSGNVRMKLTIAEEYAKSNPEYKRNIDSLKAVIPKDIKAEEITVQMGCPWIEAEDYTAFLEHLSGRKDSNSRSCNVSYSPVTGEFDVLNAKSQKNLNLNETTTYGTNDLNMYQLAEKILNQRQIVVKCEKVNPKDPIKIITKRDTTATKIAIEKAKLIRSEFQKWIFADEKRRAKYERKYNNIFNSIVGRDYDGSHLTFSGMANDFILRPHQKNCVARAIYGGNTLAAHVVGAGKSAVIFTSVMKKKELGLINKACVVVPKALTEQTANEWRKVYPDAKILTVTNDDLSNETKRKLFTAKVATGSYDAVILSQEQFEKIPMSKQYRIKFMQKEIDSIEDMLREKKLQNRGKKDYSVKAVEKAKKRMQEKLEKLLNPKSASREKDDLLEFEQLGFDYLVCDEAHAYKNGFVQTKMINVAGVTTKPSGRAEDMQMKTDYFNENFGQGHILFSTGTPVSNSMTELYVMTRYLRPDLLKQAGVDRFDDWASTFGKVVTKNQQTADGGLKMKTSFSNFANLPELMAMYKEFADIQSAEKLNLPRPELKTGKPQIISVKATPEQKMYVRELAERAKMIEQGMVEPHEDNLLKITNEARLVGLGNNAIKALYEKRGEELPYEFVDDKSSKVDKCVEKVAEIYEKTNETKSVQIIFSDVAVNSTDGNFSVYDYIKSELIEKGIPEDEIIFAPKSDSKERENIFRDINNSKYCVVIASTGTLGTGANIQQNLYALHHIDVPWKPSDFEQREGRILRQGNKNNEVEIFNYVTEGTLDSYLYQTVTNKARFIAQLLDNQTPARVSEDCDEKVLTYGEIQAAAEGNPDFKRRIEVSNEIAELTMMKNSYDKETAVTREKIKKIPEEIKLKKEMLSHVRNDMVSAEKINEISLKSNNYVVMTKEKVNKYLMKMVQEKIANPEKEILSININNFKVSVYSDRQGNAKFSVQGENTYSCLAGIAENSDNYQRLHNLFEDMIPKKEKEIIKEISELEENLEQAKNRVEKPFEHEKELEEKIEELQKLEEKLSGLSVQEDVIFDPEEEEIIETLEEKSARETIYNVDDNDYQPTENDNKSNNIRH